jgi:hypothetical protein
MLLNQIMYPKTLINHKFSFWQLHRLNKETTRTNMYPKRKSKKI